MKQGVFKKVIADVKSFLKRLSKKEIEAVLIKGNEWREFLMLPPFNSIDEMVESECEKYVRISPTQRNCIKPIAIFHIRYREAILLPIFDKLKRAGVPAEIATQHEEVRRAMRIIEMKTGVMEKIPAELLRKNGY